MDLSAEHRVVAHGLIERRGRCLLLRRRVGRYLGGQWDIPGGSVEQDESPAQAAVRECLEETGLSVASGPELTRYQNVDTEGRSIVFHTVTYELQLLGLPGAVRLNAEEHDAYLWRAPHDVGDLPLVWHVAGTLSQIRG